MAILKVKCRNPLCNTPVFSNTDKWGTTKQIIIISCPKCKQLIEKHINPNFNKKGETELIAPLSGHVNTLSLNDYAGWLIDIATKKYYPLKLKKQTFGRISKIMPSDISVETTDYTISRAHCIIEAKQSATGAVECMISDNESKNGVIINEGKRLSEGELLFLQDTDVITLGNLKFIFLSIEKLKNEASLLEWVQNSLK